MTNGPALTLGRTFNPRNNALNFLRLQLALLVILSHSILLGGYPRSEVIWGHTTLGTIAVDGFFAISGFLITASALRTSVTRYFWQRFLRIFPAFWVCLLITALVAGPAGWLAEGSNSISGYWNTSSGPADYIAQNFLLKMREYGISGTLKDVPFPNVWNGSLWSLWYEFLCYAMVGALLLTRQLRRRRIVLSLWILSWLMEVWLTLSGGLAKLAEIPHAGDLPIMIRLVPIFFAGAVLWLYRDKIPDSTCLAVVTFLLFTAGTFSGHPGLSAPTLAYVCIWASIHLPAKSIGSRYDISYGAYIYAFVVAQLLAVWHLHTLGYLPFTLLTILATFFLAFASCILIEQPALRLKNWTPPVNKYLRRHRQLTDI